MGLVGAGYLSLGLLMSALTKSQFLGAHPDGARAPRALHPRHRRVRDARGNDGSRRLRVPLGVGADERLRAAAWSTRGASSSTRRSLSCRCFSPCVWWSHGQPSEPRRRAVPHGRGGSRRRRCAHQRGRGAALHARRLDERQALHADEADARDAPHARGARSRVGARGGRQSDGAEPSTTSSRATRPRLPSSTSTTSTPTRTRSRSRTCESASTLESGAAPDGRMSGRRNAVIVFAPRSGTGSSRRGISSSQPRAQTTSAPKPREEQENHRGDTGRPRGRRQDEALLH